MTPQEQHWFLGWVPILKRSLSPISPPPCRRLLLAGRWQPIRRETISGNCPSILMAHLQKVFYAFWVELSLIGISHSYSWLLVTFRYHSCLGYLIYLLSWLPQLLPIGFPSHKDYGREQAAHSIKIWGSYKSAKYDFCSKNVFPFEPRTIIWLSSVL